MAVVLITGGTGMIGSALTRALLQKGYEVIVLTRDPEKQKTPSAGLSYAKWDVAKKYVDKDAITKADHIIHLAGEGIGDKRWTKRRKRKIVDSRVNGVELIMDSLVQNPNQVKTVVGASAIGWYGADPVIPNTNPFREEQPPAEGFLGQTCKQWEEGWKNAANIGKRSVIVRTGLVLNREGGLLEAYKTPLRWGFATILGNGKQVVSWIHIDDLVRIYLLAIEDGRMEGVYNAVAPMPVSNKELVLAYSHLRKGNFFIPVYIPPFILKIALGEMREEVLKSCTVSCDKLHHEGFVFVFPSLQSAMKNL